MAASAIAVTVEAEAGASLASAFSTIAPIELEKIFRGFGPLPAVTGTREQTGGWDHVGATRVVELGDGSEARERLTAYEAPTYFAYRLSGFTGAIRHLVTHAEGEWWFFETGNGTTGVRWSYAIHPRAGRAALVRAAIVPMWRAYQRRALTLALDEAAKAAA
jgi:hypothetical protein